jgi:hypothetical protein
LERYVAKRIPPASQVQPLSKNAGDRSSAGHPKPSVAKVTLDALPQIDSSEGTAEFGLVARLSPLRCQMAAISTIWPRQAPDEAQNVLRKAKTAGLNCPIQAKAKQSPSQGLPTPGGFIFSTDACVFIGNLAPLLT